MSLKMSLFATEFTGCIISWAFVRRMNILHQTQNFFPSDLLSAFGLNRFFLDPFLCDFRVGSLMYEK